MTAQISASFASLFFYAKFFTTGRGLPTSSGFVTGLPDCGRELGAGRLTGTAGLARWALKMILSGASYDLLLFGAAFYATRAF